jgi:hypothetical protein
MTHLLRFVAALVRWLRRSPAEREAEIIYLRQQLVVLKHSAPGRPKLRATDRLIFVCLYRLFPCLLDASIILSQRPSCDGTEPAFACFGGGSHVGRWADPLCLPISGALFGASVERTLCGVHRASTASCLCSASRSPNRPWLSTWFGDMVHHRRAGKPSSAITPPHCRHRHVCRADHRFRAALWISRRPP